MDKHMEGTQSRCCGMVGFAVAIDQANNRWITDRAKRKCMGPARALIWATCFLILGAAGCREDAYKDYSWKRVADAGGVFASPNGGIFLSDVAQATSLGASGAPGYVVVGAERGSFGSGATLKAAVWTSADGQNWTRLPDHPNNFTDYPGNPNPSDYSISAVTRFRNKLVAVGRKRLASPPHPDAPSQASAWLSDDGVQWTWHQIGSTAPPNVGPWLEHGPIDGPADVAASEQEVVAVGSSHDQAVVWRSTDGVTWQVAFTAPGNPPSHMTSIVRTNNEYVAVGCYRDQGPALWRSADGTTWTEQRGFDGGRCLFGLALQQDGWGWVFGRRTDGAFVAWKRSHTGQIDPPTVLGSSLTYPPFTSRSIHGNLGPPLISVYHDDNNALTRRWGQGAFSFTWLSSQPLSMHSPEIRAYALSVVSFQDAAGKPVRFVVGYVRDASQTPGFDEGLAKGAIWIWRKW